MWRLKYLIIGMLPAAIVGVGMYLLAPTLADSLRDAVRDSAQSAVTDVFEREAPSTVEPGQVVITENQLTQAIENADRRDDTWEVDDIKVSIDGGRVSIKGIDEDLSDGSLDIASAVPVVENGQVLMTERSGVLTIFKSARDAIADQVEAEIALIFERSGVVPVSVTAEGGRLVIVTEATETGGLTADAQGTPGSLIDALGLKTPTATP